MYSDRPSKVIIKLSAIAKNYRAIKAYAKSKMIMPILKADAYGHGLIEVANCLVNEQADYFGLAFLEEAILLRKAGIKTPILVLGGLSGREIDGFFDYDIDFTASSIFKLEKIEAAAVTRKKKARVHLKIDTGMERIGVHYYSADDFLQKALSCRHIEICSIFSHFADAERANHAFSYEQISRFESTIAKFEKMAGFRPLCHMANSGAIVQLPEAHYDIVRPGLLLYGINPCLHLKNAGLDLEAALELKSEVVYFKVVKAGASVSYDCTWTAKEQTRVVTIPLGYGDGYPRRLGNQANVIIRGQLYPVIGKVCMDQLMVDIGPNGEAYNGDEVVLVGTKENLSISVQELAALSDQDPREFLLSLKLRLPREYL